MFETMKMMDEVDQIDTVLLADTRAQGFFQRKQTKWQHSEFNITSFQMNQIYKDRLFQLSRLFKKQQIKFCIQDLNNKSNIKSLTGIFKRIQYKRIRAFQPDYQARYNFKNNIYSNKDDYQLQDQTGKIRLDFTNLLEGTQAINIPDGAVIRCYGTYKASANKYKVNSIQFPKFQRQNLKQSYIEQQFYQQSLNPEKSRNYILAVSEPTIQTLNNIYEFLKRGLQKRNSLNPNKYQSDKQSQKMYQKSGQISQLIIIGGISNADVKQIRKFDQLVCQCGSIVDTFIVPSSGLHKSHVYPLKSYHQSLLPQAYKHANVGNCTNPQIIQSKKAIKRLNRKMRIYVSCGQNLKNLKINCQSKDDFERMKNILMYAHFCPSSGFSLPIQSYNYDPLVFLQAPDIMIHGNCDNTGQSLTQIVMNDKSPKKVLLVGISEDKTILINFKNQKLSTETIQIQNYKFQI